MHAYIIHIHTYHTGIHACTKTYTNIHSHMYTYVSMDTHKSHTCTYTQMYASTHAVIHVHTCTPVLTHKWMREIFAFYIWMDQTNWHSALNEQTTGKILICKAGLICQHLRNLDNGYKCLQWYITTFIQEIQQPKAHSTHCRSEPSQVSAHPVWFPNAGHTVLCFLVWLPVIHSKVPLNWRARYRNPGFHLTWP